jgi:hypothetical protein
MLVCLLQESWPGAGTLIERRVLSGSVLIPDLAYEAQLHLPGDLPLDAAMQLALRDLDLPRLGAVPGDVVVQVLDVHLIPEQVQSVRV